MSAAADTADRTQRFNEAARAFTPPSPTRHAKLMPMKDGIIELRQKGASLRMIRELLATVDVAVGTDTIARFLAEVTGEPAPERRARRPARRRPVVASANGREDAAAPPITQASGRPQTPATTETTAAPMERTRTRGPRVADPRNL
jgi:hypothetical protein